MIVGIDLGGTKIETGAFGPDLKPLAIRRVPTPTSSFDELVDALVGEYRWACDAAGQAGLRLGIGVPGLVDVETGAMLASNLPLTDRSLPRELEQRIGAPVFADNDCRCFALSEANGGSGDGYDTVFGLILGTGCGGGVCYRGRLVNGRNGLPGEVGHLGIPAGFFPALPLLACPCGRGGCYETLVSGPGLALLAEHLTGTRQPAAAIAEKAASGDAASNSVLDVWGGLVSELIRTIQLTVDPDCIVIGGGLSRIPDIIALLERHLPDHLMDRTRLPALKVAAFGDSSGIRGATMLAMNPTLADFPGDKS
jgi:predicted NBD/HSP70 family sugar kinase